MLRVESETGWWLIRHCDHAHLAAAFAAHWGNQRFIAPEPRSSVLKGICVHDNGWSARDAQPRVTPQGKPSAFSHELVGKYSAFEEIDLIDYLAVREQALLQIEAEDAYAALLVSMHTYNLLTDRADRSTIAANQLRLLDTFLENQLTHQKDLLTRLVSESVFSSSDLADRTVVDNFHLLQAVDNLSLYSCVGYRKTGTLLHPLPTVEGEATIVEVFPVATRHFRLKPYPLDEPLLTFTVAARHVLGKAFGSSKELADCYHSATETRLQITLSK